MKNWLRVLRAGRNWSQADLAEQLEVSRQTINAIETEKYDPSPVSYTHLDVYKRQARRRRVGAIAPAAGLRHARRAARRHVREAAGSDAAPV